MHCPQHRVGLLLSLAMLAAGALCPAAEIEWQTDVDAAWKQARQQDRPLLVFISTSGCRYCTLMQTVSFADPEVCELLEQGFVPTAVDAKDVAWLVRDQKVGSYPTTIIITPSAEVVDKIKGYVKPAELKSRLAKSAATNRTALKQQNEKK